MTNTTETPNACPHTPECDAGYGCKCVTCPNCGAERHPFADHVENWVCELCREREKSQKLESEVERLTSALKSCWWATNTYDGNYAKACDNVATIVTNALKTQDDK